ncbi:bacillolysin [Stackebrandtia albiflava]|uniref:Bacillolysin n=1 Tax=Stackebrandtia albiflava TaxID=406432 RepID=A0A562V3J8_9ACTN|nr:M4 family metallopeptidase [Stackebrandtia albiflava]TWJ12387.1 bacillolysin [Stackebrandtia albiflava]
MRPTRARLLAVTAAVCAVTLGLPAMPAAAEETDNPDVTLDPASETPVQVTGFADETTEDDPAAAAVAHLADHTQTYVIADPAGDLTELGVTGDDGQTTVRFGQTFEGVPVFGAQYLVHMTDGDDGRVVTGATGKFFTELDVDTTADATESTATERAEGYILAGIADGWVSTEDAPEVASESHGLTVLPDGSGRLVWHVTVRTFDPQTGTPVQREVFLDADAAFPVLDYSSVRFADVTGTGVTADGRTVDVRLTETTDGYELRDSSRALSDGDITTWDGRGYDVSSVLGLWPSGLTPYSSPDTHVDGDLSEAGAVDAHVNAGHVYDYYASLGRDGLDGQGSAIDSITGVTQMGQPFVNAFWDGRKMVYGSGDAEYHSMAAETDVVGHEMTHGVIEHSANLVYAHQSGAMNEALADYFGNAIDVEVNGTDMSDPDAGLIGEDLCRTLSPRDCALRDLNDGATTADYNPVTYDYDGGGVHFNSTIFGGALWDIREALGGEDADRLVYKALTEYMTPLDDFVDGRNAVIAAAVALKLSLWDVLLIGKAFVDHGIWRGWEARLGMDGKELLGPVTTTRTEPNAKDGVWTTSNSDASGADLYQVFTGKTTGRSEPIQLSTEDTVERVFNVYPVTDGEWVAWAAWGDHYISIMRAKADGSGEPEEVARTAGNFSNLTISGDHLAWQMTDYRFGSKVVYMEVGGQPTPVDNTYYQNSWTPYIHEGTLLYLNIDIRTEYDQIEPVLLDLETGEKTVLPLPDYDPEYGVRWMPPVMTDDHIVAFADLAPGATGTLLRYSRDGGAPTVLIDENAEGAPIPGGVDATDQAITFSHWPGTTVPKIMQIPIDGGTVEQVSCSAGMQPMFDADSGTRVVYFDGAAGHTALVTRNKPNPRC